MNDYGLESFIDFCDNGCDPAVEGLKEVGKRIVVEFVNFLEHIIAFCEKAMANFARLKKIEIPKEIYTYGKAIYQRLKKLTSNIVELDEVDANRGKLAEVQNDASYRKVMQATANDYPIQTSWVELDSSQKKEIYNEFKFMRNLLTRTKNQIRRQNPDTFFDPAYAEENGYLEIKKVCIQAAIGVLNKILYFGKSKEVVDGNITYLSQPIEATVR